MMLLTGRNSFEIRSSLYGTRELGFDAGSRHCAQTRVRRVAAVIAIALLASITAVALSAPSAFADEPSSANYTSRGGHFGTSGTDFAVSTAASPRFMGSGTALGHPVAGGFTGSTFDLQTHAPGFWALVAGAFPNIDFDGDGLQGYRDTDDDDDGLPDVVETNTGVFNGADDTGSNPYAADTDADGYSDFAEVDAMTDPNDAFDFPGFAAVPGLGLVAMALLTALMLGSGTRSFRNRRSGSFTGGAFLAFAMATGSLFAAVDAANAAVPGQVHYQGLLLDSVGTPVDGLEDFEFRLYDAATLGTLLWTETHDDVDVVSGVYYVELGFTTPITDPILDNTLLYLEIEVGGETLSPRERLLAVPYALRARSAETADLATTAVTAQSLGAIDGDFLSEILEHQSFDGQPPSNLDPREGLGDADSDGVANFLDADNDNDGLLDGDEIAQGSDINVVTPTVSGTTPLTADGFITTAVSVQGTNFEAGMTVQFGTENPTPSSITPTSFDVSVGPQASAVVGVTVTRLNGEAGTGSFEFITVTPTVSGTTPLTADALMTTAVTVQGTNFEPGMTVQFGTESPTPSSITPTSFDASVGPQAPGVVVVTVTRLNGEADMGSFEFLSVPTITGYVPGFGQSTATQTITVQGTNFQAGMVVNFGSETPTATSITPTSFDVVVGPQAAGFVNVDVTRTEGGFGASTFEFLDSPTIASLSPTFGDPFISQLVTVTGTGFAAGMTVSFGSESPTPSSITATSFDVTVGPQPVGEVDVQVTRLDGGVNVPAQFNFKDDLVIFTTLTVIDGNIGGIAGADAICASEATTAGLPGTFLAWMSTSTTSPDARFTKLQPYRLAPPVATPVATSYADLADGSIAVVLDTDATGTTIVGLPASLWTGTSSAGLPSAANCGDWTITGSTGTTGKLDQIGGGWSQFATKACSSTARLICVEQ